MNNTNKIEVTINGKEYVVKGLESNEYIQQVAVYIDKKMNEVSESDPRMNTAMVAVLAAINVADDLFKNRDKYKQLEEYSNAKIEELEKTKANLKEALDEVSLLREKLTEQQFELVKTKTELKDLLTNYSKNE